MVPTDFLDTARRLAGAARRLHRSTTTAALLEGLPEEALALAGADAVSVSATSGGSWRVVGATASGLRRQGPPPACLTREDPPGGWLPAGSVSHHRVDDLLGDERCADWAAGLRVEGWSRVWVARLQDAAGGPVFGALTFCFGDAGALPPDGREELFAQHLALAWSRLEERDQVRALIDVHHEVGKAQGVLMARHNLDAEESLRVLMRLAEHGDRTLQQAAAEVAAPAGAVRPGS